MTEDLTKFAELFKDDYGKSLHLSAGQKEIFEAILRRFPKRNIVMCATQYGKSLTVSLGILIRAVVFGERWAIVAPSEKKARIIMNYVIQHIFDNPLFYKQLEISEPLERLKRERSKERLTFKRGGEIFILSADARNRKKAGESLLGFGAANLVLDECSLIDDDVYATAKRMVGGHIDNFILEIGNPFRRNHFLKTWQSDGYNKIKITWEQGVREGRFSKEFIEEMKDEAFFKILYECQFPELGEIDEQGWSVLVTDKEIDTAMERITEPCGKRRLGVDIGRGGDYTVFVLRTDNYARVLEKNRDPDLMAQVGRIKRIMQEQNILAEDVFIDDVGVGGGVTDRLKEQGIIANAIKGGEKAKNESKFVNIRAESFWELRKWVLEGGTLERNEDFYQLYEIRYKEDSSSRLKIESKEEIRSRGSGSPDIADALMLTFAGPAHKFSFTFGDIVFDRKKYESKQTETESKTNTTQEGGIKTTIIDTAPPWKSEDEWRKLAEEEDKKNHQKEIDDARSASDEGRFYWFS